VSEGVPADYTNLLLSEEEEPEEEDEDDDVQATTATDEGQQEEEEEEDDNDLEIAERHKQTKTQAMIDLFQDADKQSLVQANVTKAANN